MARRPRLPWVEAGQPLPSPEQAPPEFEGLIAAGADLSADRLLEAYGRGMFPWYSDGQPVLWWSPNPRMVLYLDRLRVTRSLTKTLRRVAAPGGWRITLDQAFPTVMRACAAPRAGQGGTWITEDIIAAYTALHRRGLAHSVEVWGPAEDDADGQATDTGDQLIGGLYGVSLGRMFFGESMFARRTDASKVALVSWARQLQALGFRVIDCQQDTSHLASFGAITIPRRRFLDELAELTVLPAPDWGAIRLALPELALPQV